MVNAWVPAWEPPAEPEYTPLPPVRPRRQRRLSFVFVDIIFPKKGGVVFDDRNPIDLNGSPNGRVHKVFRDILRRESTNAPKHYPTLLSTVTTMIRQACTINGWHVRDANFELKAVFEEHTRAGLLDWLSRHPDSAKYPGSRYACVFDDAFNGLVKKYDYILKASNGPTPRAPPKRMLDDEDDDDTGLGTEGDDGNTTIKGTERVPVWTQYGQDCHEAPTEYSHLPQDPNEPPTCVDLQETPIANLLLLDLDQVEATDACETGTTYKPRNIAICVAKACQEYVPREKETLHGIIYNMDGKKKRMSCWNADMYKRLFASLSDEIANGRELTWKHTLQIVEQEMLAYVSRHWSILEGNEAFAPMTEYVIGKWTYLKSQHRLQKRTQAAAKANKRQRR